LVKLATRLIVEEAEPDAGGDRAQAEEAELNP
jgi:hypothetical protein